jgi:hypothetical protein
VDGRLDNALRMANNVLRRTHAGSGDHGMAEEMAILSFGFATTV